MAYLQIIRPVNCLFTLVSVLVGAWAARMMTFPAAFIIAGIAGFLACAFGNVVNDIADVEIDRINCPDRPLPAGRMSARAAVIFSSLLAASSVALGVWLGLLPALMVVLVLALLFCYARFFKKSPLANLIVSLTAGLSFVFGGIVAENIFCLIPFIFAILIHMPREIIKDVIDLKGDRASGVRSLPVLWGEKNSLRLAGLFLLMLVFLTPLPYFMNIMGIAYLVVVVFCALPLLVLLAIAAMRTPTPRSLRMQSNTIKLVMGIGLFAFLCG